MIYKTLHRKIEQHKSHLNRVWIQRIRNGEQFCSTSDTRRVAAKWHEQHVIWTPIYVNNYKQQAKHESVI